MTERQTVASGARWESVVGYSRAVRVGPWVSVSGTTAASDGHGGVVGGQDVAAQTREVLRRIEAALGQLGAGLGDVVRTRIMSAPIGSSPAPLTLMRSIAHTEVNAGRRCRLTFHQT